MNKLLLYIMLLLLIISSVSAAKPTQVFTGDVGLEIRIPQAEFVEHAETIQINVHVYNLSDGLLMTNDTTSCNYHLYNKTGYHLLFEDMNFDSEDMDFYLDVDGGNFTQIGFHSFIIGCNTSSIGGFVSGNFRISRDGNDDTNKDRTAGFVVIVFMLFLTIPFFVLPFVKKAKDEILDFVLGGCSIILGLGMLLFTNTLVMHIAEKGGLMLIEEFTFTMFLIAIVIRIAMMIVMFIYMFKTILSLQDRKKKRRLGEE